MERLAHLMDINCMYLSVDLAVAHGSHAVATTVQCYLRLYLLDLFRPLFVTELLLPGLYCGRNVSVTE